jgi:hypothetical protein
MIQGNPIKSKAIEYPACSFVAPAKRLDERLLEANANPAAEPQRTCSNAAPLQLALENPITGGAREKGHLYFALYKYQELVKLEIC